MTTPQEIISRQLARWDDAEGLPETTLLRLAMLRDLVRALHSEKSVCLATGKRAESQQFGSLEKKLGELRGAFSLSGRFNELIEAPSLRKRTRLLPEALFAAIPREKFDRYDRQWESVIAAEAIALGWRFWELDAWVSVREAESWHRQLGEQLIPHGIILFAESISDPPDVVRVPAEVWHGRWTTVLQPSYATPDFRVRSLPGTSLEPAEPRWRMVFSPRSQ
jgi:hypothetical protein